MGMLCDCAQAERPSFTTKDTKLGSERSLDHPSVVKLKARFDCAFGA
jgi:hypothetical protein